MSFYEITWKISYVNMIMMGASIRNDNEKGKEVKDNGTISGADLYDRLKGK